LTCDSRASHPRRMMRPGAARPMLSAKEASDRAPAADHSVVIVHGNGPQVGLPSLQAESYRDVEPYPLDVLDAGGWCPPPSRSRSWRCSPSPGCWNAGRWSSAPAAASRRRGRPRVPASRFVTKTGQRAAIGSLSDITEIVAGTAGTNLLPRGT